VVPADPLDTAAVDENSQAVVWQTAINPEASARTLPSRLVRAA